MRQALLNGFRSPGLVGFGFGGAPGARFATQRLAIGHQTLGRVRTAVEQHILHEVPKLRLDLLVHFEHPGIDDAHVEPGLNGVEEEGTVHRLPNMVVAPETKADVGDAAADLGEGQVGLNPSSRLDEVDGVVVVDLDPGGDGEDVRIENNVLRRELCALGEQVITPLANLDAARKGIGLSLLIKGHHHDRRAIATNESGLFKEALFAFFERNGIDDALALEATQARLQHRPLRRIDHDRHPSDVGFGRDQIEELRHRRSAVEHSLVHVDIDDLGPRLDLLFANRQRGIVVAGQDEFGEFR